MHSLILSYYGGLCGSPSLVYYPEELQNILCTLFLYVNFKYYSFCILFLGLLNSTVLDLPTFRVNLFALSQSVAAFNSRL